MKWWLVIMGWSALGMAEYTSRMVEGYSPYYRQYDEPSYSSYSAPQFESSIPQGYESIDPDVVSINNQRVPYGATAARVTGRGHVEFYYPEKDNIDRFVQQWQKQLDSMVSGAKTRKEERLSRIKENQKAAETAIQSLKDPKVRQMAERELQASVNELKQFLDNRAKEVHESHNLIVAEGNSIADEWRNTYFKKKDLTTARTNAVQRDEKLKATMREQDLIWKSQNDVFDAKVAELSEVSKYRTIESRLKAVAETHDRKLSEIASREKFQIDSLQAQFEQVWDSWVVQEEGLIEKLPLDSLKVKWKEKLEKVKEQLTKLRDETVVAIQKDRTEKEAELKAGREEAEKKTWQSSQEVSFIHQVSQVRQSGRRESYPMHYPDFSVARQGYLSAREMVERGELASIRSFYLTQKEATHAYLTAEEKAVEDAGKNFEKALAAAESVVKTAQTKEGQKLLTKYLESRQRDFQERTDELSALIQAERQTREANLIKQVETYVDTYFASRNKSAAAEASNRGVKQEEERRANYMTAREGLMKRLSALTSSLKLNDLNLTYLQGRLAEFDADLKNDLKEWGEKSEQTEKERAEAQIARLKTIENESVRQVIRLRLEKEEKERADLNAAMRVLLEEECAARKAFAEKQYNLYLQEYLASGDNNGAVKVASEYLKQAEPRKLAFEKEKARLIAVGVDLDARSFTEDKWQPLIEKLKRVADFEKEQVARLVLWNENEKKSQESANSEVGDWKKTSSSILSKEPYPLVQGAVAKRVKTFEMRLEQALNRLAADWEKESQRRREVLTTFLKNQSQLELVSAKASDEKLGESESWRNELAQQTVYEKSRQEGLNQLRALLQQSASQWVKEERSRYPLALTLDPSCEKYRAQTELTGQHTLVYQKVVDKAASSQGLKMNLAVETQKSKCLEESAMMVLPEGGSCLQKAVVLVAGKKERDLTVENLCLDFITVDAKNQRYLVRLKTRAGESFTEFQYELSADGKNWDVISVD